MALDLPDLKAFLLETPFFGGLSETSLDRLVTMLVERRFEVGETVVREGEPGRSLYIVLSGELTVSMRLAAAQSVQLSTLSSGDFFGEMTIIAMQNRSATIHVDRPAVLYELTAQNFYRFYKADIHAYVLVLQNINRELCRRLRHADSHIAALKVQEAQGAVSGGPVNDERGDR